MPKRFQVLMEGSGFCVQMGNGKPVAGFLTERRLKAADNSVARQKAVESLWVEPKVQSLLKATTQSGMGSTLCTIKVKRIIQISWRQWHFSPFMKGFAFYENFDKERQD